MDNRTFEENRKTRGALRHFIKRERWKYAVTFNFNRPMTPANARKKLKDWQGTVDRRLFGASYRKRKARAERTFFVAIPQRAHRLHYHAVLDFPSSRADQFERIAEQVWRKVVPSGRLGIEVLKTPSDTRNWSRYITRATEASSQTEDWVLSTEFEPVS